MKDISIHKWSKENTLNDIKDAAYTLAAKSAEYTGPIPNGTIEISVYTSGLGIEIVNKIIQKEAMMAGFVIQPQSEEIIEKSQKFTRLNLPFLGTLAFEEHSVLELEQESAIFIMNINK